MLGLLLVIVLTIALCAIVSPLMAATALSRTRALEAQLSAVRLRLDGIEPPSRRPGTDEAAEDRGEESEEVGPQPYPGGTEVAHEPAFTPDPVTPLPEPEEPAEPAPSLPPPVSTIPEGRVAPRTVSFEEKIASKWMVWLGSATIGIGGVFLVKYSIDHNVLSPAVRIFLGCMLGITLVCGGEWLRRTPTQLAIAAIRPNYIPPALTAAGVVIGFGSIYAGYALYGLLSPLAAFAGMSTVAALALALSLLQGPFIAAIGILGAFVVPLLVQTGSPSAWALFTYLTFVVASALAVLRYRDWAWLGWCSLAGTALWGVTWIVGIWRPADTLPLAIHVLLLLVLFIAMRFKSLVRDGKRTVRALDLASLTHLQALVVGASVVVSILVILLTRVDGHSLLCLALSGTVIAALCATAYRVQLEALLPLSALLALITLALWQSPVILSYPEHLTYLERSLQPLPSSAVPAELTAFVLAALGIATLFGGAGYAGLWRSKTPGLWAGVSASMPVLVFAIAYWRMNAAGADLAWGAIGLSLAGVASLAVNNTRRHQSRDGFNAVIGSYALAVIGAVSVSASIMLEETWLTIALALQLPAIARVHDRLGISPLRPIALAVALVVVVRMVHLHWLPGIPMQVHLDAFWILYSYGIPAACFWLAAREFRRRADDTLVGVLEAATIATAVALVSMEIRLLAGDGTLGYARYSLLEQSLHSIAWLVSAYGLYRRHRKSPRAIMLWSARGLAALAAAQIVVLQIFASNPLFSLQNVGALPVLNVVTLAYGIPAGLALLFHIEAKRQNHTPIAQLAGAAALVLFFIDVTLEVRHMFHGSYLHIGRMSDAEGYVYSLAWLIYAGALLALGIRLEDTKLRYASLALILLVTAKVFLWDMAWLAGLYRAGSFLGLGLALIGVGYLYQRYVFRPDRKEISA